MRRQVALALALIIGLSPGCKSSDGPLAPDAAVVPEPVDPRKAMPAALVLPPRNPGYWDHPTARQGRAPGTWSALERTLLPQDCGTCHPKQLQDWRGALHSKAMGPGMLAQLLDDDWKFAADCYECHAPLFEQHKKLQNMDGEWVDNPRYDHELRGHGISCAVCHVRQRRVHGPPPLDGKPRDNTKLPHGGFTVDAQFQSAELCGTCHQFPPGWKSLNGKLLQDTLEEWKKSPAAAEGKTCQSCHMPDRRHLFRGIHDPEMTRKAFAFEARLEGPPADGKVRAFAKLTNVGAGHMAPTYVTPRIVMDFQAVDAAGEPLGEASEPTIIQRQVVLGGDDEREISDTRLAPGASAEAKAALPLAEGAVAIRAQVRCIPDQYYEEYYKRLLKKAEDGGEEQRLLKQALAEAESRRFLVYEKRLALPGSAP